MNYKPKVYRAMYRQEGLPAVGDGDFQLGVRVPPQPNADVQPVDGDILPRTGGMSVFAALKKLPGRLIPSRLRDLYPDDLQKARGDDDLVVWCLGDGEFEDGLVTENLVLRLDKPGEKRHGLIEPRARMKMEQYQAALQATAQDWNVCEEPE